MRIGSPGQGSWILLAAFGCLASVDELLGPARVDWSETSEAKHPQTRAFLEHATDCQGHSTLDETCSGFRLEGVVFLRPVTFIPNEGRSGGSILHIALIRLLVTSRTGKGFGCFGYCSLSLRFRKEPCREKRKEDPGEHRGGGGGCQGEDMSHKCA